jgi:hypothetical protein
MTAPGFAARGRRRRAVANLKAAISACIALDKVSRQPANANSTDPDLNRRLRTALSAAQGHAERTLLEAVDAYNEAHGVKP